MKKIIAFTKEWEELANQLARDFAPTAYPCGKCNFPVLSGYCCTFCHDSNPEQTEKQEREFEEKYSKK